MDLERFNFIKRFIMKKRLERVSEILMKDLILEGNKEDVIKYAKHFLKEKDPIFWIFFILSNSNIILICVTICVTIILERLIRGIE